MTDAAMIHVGQITWSHTCRACTCTLRHSKGEIMFSNYRLLKCCPVHLSFSTFKAWITELAVDESLLLEYHDWLSLFQLETEPCLHLHISAP